MWCYLKFTQIYGDWREIARFYKIWKTHGWFLRNLAEIEINLWKFYPVFFFNFWGKITCQFIINLMAFIWINFWFFEKKNWHFIHAHSCIMAIAQELRNIPVFIVRYFPDLYYASRIKKTTTGLQLLFWGNSQKNLLVFNYKPTISDLLVLILPFPWLIFTTKC